MESLGLPSCPGHEHDGWHRTCDCSLHLGAVGSWAGSPKGLGGKDGNNGVSMPGCDAFGDGVSLCYSSLSS